MFKLFDASLNSLLSIFGWSAIIILPLVNKAFLAFRSLVEYIWEIFYTVLAKDFGIDTTILKDRFGCFTGMHPLIKQSLKIF